MTLQGTLLDARFDAGACGMIPRIRIDSPKPKLHNNGWACYLGHPPVHVPGLSAALPDDPERTFRQGHVMLEYADGQRFQTYADTLNGDTIRPY